MCSILFKKNLAGLIHIIITIVGFIEHKIDTNPLMRLSPRRESPGTDMGQHLKMVIYNNEPNKDCGCLLVQLDLEVHCVHIFCISSNFPGGIDMVLEMVLTNIPKQANLDLSKETTETDKNHIF